MQNGFEKALEIIKKRLEAKACDYTATTDEIKTLLDLYVEVSDAYIKALKEGQTND